MRILLHSLLLPLIFWGQAGFGADLPVSSRAMAAIRKAVDFYQNQVPSQGGYVYRDGADLR